MLELENISFSADSDGGEKEIIKNISLKINERLCCNNRAERRRQIHTR